MSAVRCLLPLLCWASLSLAAGGPVRLAAGPHLFIDDYLIAESKNLTRTTHRPEKLAEPILPKGEPWHEMPLFFLKVIYDPNARLYRMWYNIRNNTSGYPFTVYAYAESQDGLKWRRPNVGLVDVKGSTDNNLFKVVPAFGLGFVDDGPNASPPERRYKLAYYHLQKPQGMFVAFSRDGLHFKDWPRNPVLTELGDIIDACWDPLRQVYLAILKVDSAPSDGYKGSTPNAPEGYRRLVGQSVSKDFIHWAKPRRIVVADSKEPGIWEFYGASPQMRGNLYLGFLRVLRDDLPAGRTGQKGIGWTELITSRDGDHWTRHREPFLDRDPRDGAFDYAMAWFGDVITVGDQEYIYYCGYSAGHKIGDRQIGFASLRKNGFVSRDAVDVEGTLRTPPAQLDARKMTINAKVDDELRVRVVDAAGKPVPGFDRSGPIRGDSVSHPVRWKSGLGSLKGMTVRLQFTLRRAQLYGFDLR